MMQLPHIDSTVHAANGLAAMWLRAAINRGADPRGLLQGSGLFLDDWHDPSKRVSSRQLQRLFRNLCTAGLGQDMPLVLGARTAMADLPLWSVTSWRHGERTWLTWDGAHQELSHDAMHAMAVAASVRTGLRDVAGEDANWTFHFRHRDAEAFPDAWAFLGANLKFAQPANLICIEGAVDPVAITRAQPPPRTFLEGIRGRLSAWPGLALPACAHQLDMSPATLKRRLQAHDTTFQRQTDLLRSMRAVELATRADYSPDDALLVMGCGTPSNLRRDMRRLLGVTMDDLHAAFA